MSGKYRDNIPRSFVSIVSYFPSEVVAAAGDSRRTAEGDEGLCVCPKCWQPLLHLMKKQHHHSFNHPHFVWCRLRGQLIDVFGPRFSKEAGWVRKVTVEVWKGRHLGSNSSSSGSRARPRRRFHSRTAHHSHQLKKVKCAYFIRVSVAVCILDGCWYKVFISALKSAYNLSYHLQYEPSRLRSG